MSIETTALYQEMRRRAPDIPACPRELVDEFERLRRIVQEHGKYIVLLFPEYTPHDHTRHLDNLFTLADRVLGTPLFTRLRATELVLLAFGLYAHDWGMAVSEAERQTLITGAREHSFDLLPDEPVCVQAFISEANLTGISSEVAWRDYVRRTHGLRSGARLRKYLEPFGSVFADAVARIAEGHTLEIRELRDTDRYPFDVAVFGETVNLAALSCYIRILDLLDIGDDRTPYALWKFIAPADPISSMEWRKHRALSPVSVRNGPALREVLVSGRTDDPAVFAALADLRSWIDRQFAISIAQLRNISGSYDLDLDSRILWNVDAVGFEPLTIRFELERSEILRLLSDELYRGDPLAFIRELLQNSVDAIDIREAVLARHGLALQGEIRIRIASHASGLCLEWSDNGIGMDEDVLASYFAGLGRTWYRSREASRLGHIEAISQFGVGVLSCFTVSRKLTIETQKDPMAGNSRPGLAVEIPARESHFRIRTVSGLPVGTTIRLEIPGSVALVSKESVCTAIARISRYVRHRITVECDGVRTVCGLEATRSDGCGITFARMRGDSAEKLCAATTVVSFEFGDLAGDYYGHYSAVVPRCPRDVTHGVDRSVWWRIGDDDNKIELDDVLAKVERALFVKGIQVGSVIGSRHHQIDESVHVPGRYTPWVGPTLFLNLRRPSQLHFNLARSSARLERSDQFNGMWREIAGKLKAAAFNWPVVSAADTALLLGSCALFGGIEDVGLEALAETNEIPLPVLHPGVGFKWRSLKEFVRGNEFIEAPFELSYVCRDSFPLFEINSGLEGWDGDDALFPAKAPDSHRYPWFDAVLGFGYRALTRLGFRPMELRIVQGPGDEAVPLFCRVWQNLGIDNGGNDWSEEGTQGGRPEAEVVKSLYDEAPEVLRFPSSMADYAAIGSRYWNLDHPKIIAITEVLKALMNGKRQHRLSGDTLRLVSYLASNTYYGYTVPSRISGITLALETPNRLVEAAEKEGLAACG